MLKDRFERQIDILRISITQECNLKCPYCHREGESNPKDTMSVDEITKIIRASADLGIKKVKITGGEPLIRKDITDIIRAISKINSIQEISMTTNGTMLKDQADDLKKAGLARLNIGCDSLSSSILPKTVDRLKSNIIAAKNAGFNSIKLNMVVLNGVNDNSIKDMTEYSKQQNTTLQLIELIRTKENKEFFQKYFYSLENIEKELASKAESIETRPMHNRKRYNLDGVTIELVRPHKSEFCANCRTLRITSDGKIKPCLMRNDNLLDILKDIRKGADSTQLTRMILEGIQRREPYVKER